MSDIQEIIITKALPGVVSFVVGPLMTFLAKKITEKAGNTISSPKIKLLISALAGAIAAIGVGDVNSLAESLGNAVTGLIGGLGGAKARDVAVDKPYVSEFPVELAAWMDDDEDNELNG